MSHDLTESLVALSAAAQRAAHEAKRAGDEALYHEVRRLGWRIAELIAAAARREAAAS